LRGARRWTDEVYALKACDVARQMARRAQVVFMMFVVVVFVGGLAEAFVVSEIVRYDCEVLLFLVWSLS